MSTTDQPPTLAETVTETVDRSVGATALQPLATRLRTAGRALAFWLGATLPLAYPALFVTGLSGSHTLGFFALVAINALLLILGHEHNQPARDAAPR